MNAMIDTANKMLWKLSVGPQGRTVAEAQSIAGNARVWAEENAWQIGDELASAIWDAADHFEMEAEAAYDAEVTLEVDYYDEAGNWTGPVRNENGWTP